MFTRAQLVSAIRLVAVASVACSGLFLVWQLEIPQNFHLWTHNGPPAELDALDSSRFLRGRPTVTVKENLLPDAKYLTSFGSGGWSNDVIADINLIYLAMITERIPLIPVFLPSHHLLNSYGYAGEDPLRFSEVFDLPYLRNATGIPIVEWDQVKANGLVGERETLGCWHVWPVTENEGGGPRPSFMPWYLKLDISYTTAPDWIKLKPGNENDRTSTFWSLASLAFPTTRNANLVPPYPSPKTNVSLQPDEHLLCFDDLYYMAVRETDELEQDYSPAWRFVGQHMRWTPYIQNLATDYLRKAFDIHDGEDVPPYIAVHVRHNDFIHWCEEGFEEPEQCFAPLDAFARRVGEMQHELRLKTGVDAQYVVVTSDEKNATWWEGVRELGWVRLDHSATKERLGMWFPILIDAVVQSMGAGFVGTARSTVSMLAGKRVQSWRDGPTAMVKWGKPGADDH
ncbi:hypothetical protein HMN09_00906300 [Mycena chlorophos]|uniref:O-fucosyltransferase family protein n=1 Tax=Mycena chlorophos TaxID=658473 RepID=A0A8H6W240_MYCCL|nr:hypothetical protein HMN09_00906300 [Mycena chlorophos]